MSDPAAWRDAIPRDRPVVVTGAAGFVGFHLSAALLDAGIPVTGFDNLNAYYDPALKRARLRELERRDGFAFVEGDLADEGAVRALIAESGARHVVHLAAQAGVRHSIDNPAAYARSNLIGHLNVLEACRAGAVAHLVYASSSSVYGGNVRTPFSASEGCDHPVSLYAATKRADELMTHAYSHLFAIPATGLRFFTVYGPWGRPDMAYWIFAEAIAEDRPITVYEPERMKRDFTYIDDVVEATARLIPRPPAPDPAYDRARPDPARSWAPHRVFNIGGERPERLPRLVEALERALGRRARQVVAPAHPGDVLETCADVGPLERATGFRPVVDLDEGVARFAAWFRDWRGLDRS